MMIMCCCSWVFCLKPKNIKQVNYKDKITKAPTYAGTESNWSFKPPNEKKNKPHDHENMQITHISTGQPHLHVTTVQMP